MQDVNNPQQWQGYSYATNNPNTFSDPSGALPITDDWYPGSTSSGGTWHNPGSGSGSSSGNTGGHEHHNANDIRHERVTLRKEVMDGINARGGLQTREVTWASLEEFVRRDTHNWEFLCTNQFGKSTEQCERANPYLNKNIKEILFVGAGVAAAVALPTCIMLPYMCAAAVYDYVSGEVATASTGSLLSASGLTGSAGLLSLAGKGASTTSKAGGLAEMAGEACSFSGDTEVLLADGTTEPIDEIEPGEKVYATNPETGEKGARTVTASWAHDDELIDLKLSVGAVTTTRTHPFWNATDRRWERADALDSGDAVANPSGLVTIEGLLKRTAHQGTAYNLSVSELHTYYVLAGTTPVLVHNIGCGVSVEREMEIAGMLQDAARQKGFSGVGAGTRAEADMMGSAWVGPGYKVASDGRTMISQDGLRQYRPPSFKPNRAQRFGGPGYQANFEWRVQPKGQWQADAHLDILD